MKRAGCTIVGLLIVVLAHHAALLPHEYAYSFMAWALARGWRTASPPGLALNSDERCIERTTLWGVGVAHDN